MMRQHQMDTLTYEEIEDQLLQNIIDVFTYGAVLERKALVVSLAKIGQLHVQADHNPPHFHIRSDDYNLSVDLNTCEILKGNLSSKQKKALKDWFFEQQGQPKLIAFWNRFNPDNQFSEAGV